MSDRPTFTTTELTTLADMLCGRVDALLEIASSPNIPGPVKRDITRDVESLAALNNKLRPFYGRA